MAYSSVPDPYVDAEGVLKNLLSISSSEELEDAEADITAAVIASIPDQPAHYYSEINILHPFREGNGRTERVFFSQLVAEAGYRLAWEQMSADENLRACIAAYDGDESLLAAMLGQMLESIDD